MDLLILGASARAAAYSALRAGLRPAALDLFADRDLGAVGPTGRIAPDDYPDGLARRAADRPVSPWIYTGALENRPDLVERIARDRPLWGNDGPTLRAVRDPVAVAGALARAGLPCPRVRLDPAGLPRDGSWLVKPLDSAGGQGIAPLSTGPAPASRPCYYQERIAGTGLAALFLASRSGTVLEGVTRQSIGRPGAPFGYTGSLGPWPLSPDEAARVEAVGPALAAAFGLVGLFGVDLVLRDGVPWPVEVNPRYTASVEVLELASGRSLLSGHRAACDPSASPPGEPSSPPADRPRFVAKQVVFASQPGRYPDRDGWSGPGADPFAIPRVADLPRPGHPFAAGEPALTVFASGPTPAACRRRLERRVRAWERRLLDPR